MSFAYLPLFTGDYLRDTRHLTPLRHGIYLLLLMHCWDQKGPIPIDEQEAAGIANCRSADEIDALRYVIQKYFVRMDDGWYNKRMMEEIETAAALSGKRSNAAHTRWDARKKLKKLNDANAMQMHNTCNAPAPSPSPSPSPSLTLEPEEEKTKTHTRFSAREYLLKNGVPEQEANDWLRVRKEKKLTPTKAAIDAIEKEAIKAGIDLPKAIHHCCENAWAGFKVSWLSKINNDEPDYANIGD